jgi:hypothetical protein
LKVGNPVGYIFEQAIDAAFPTELEKEESGFKKGLKTGMKFLGNPVIYGLEKWVEKSRSRRKIPADPEKTIGPKNMTGEINNPAKSI